MAQYTEWCDELEEALAQPFPDDVIEWVDKQDRDGKLLPSVHWTEYVRRLNDLVGGGWSMGQPILHNTSSENKDGRPIQRIILGVPITVLGVTRINFGDEDENKTAYGSAATTAWAQAFKRTCALFHLGMHLYDIAPRYGDGGQPARQSAPRSRRDTPADSTPWLDRVCVVAKRADLKGKTWRQVIEKDASYAEWAYNKKVDVLSEQELEELGKLLGERREKEMEAAAGQVNHPTKRIAIPQKAPANPFDADDDDLPF